MEVKLQLPFLALILAFLVGLPGILLAQESELVPREYHPTETHTSAPSNESIEEEELTIEEEKNTARTPPNNFISKDSVVFKAPATTSNKSKTKTVNESQRSMTDQKSTDKNSEDEDDVLSFNFLYYMFEKFKLSDIVDK